MKLFFNIAFTLLIFSTLQAQEKGDNLIVITTNRSPEENFSMFGRHLINEVYSIESKDVDFFIMRTSTKTLTTQTGYRMNIVFTENLILIRIDQDSKGLDPRSPTQTWRWKYANAGLNVQKQSYDDFNSKLLKYGYPVTYQKE